DCTSLAVGTSRGYNLYPLSSALERLDPIHANSAAEVKSKVRVVERLFSSSLVALVTQDEPRKLKAKIMIAAHGSPLAALAFNPSGERLATASEKGTAKALEDTSARRQSQCSTGNAVSLGVSYLPAQVTDTLNQTRYFATVTVPNATCCGHPGREQGMGRTAPGSMAIATIARELRLLLASSDGYLYIYNLPVDEGGECILIKQHCIDLSLVHSTSTENLSGDVGLGVERSEPEPIRDGGHALVHEGGSCSLASLLAVLKVNRPSSHSPPSLDDSPTPTMQRPEI
ncbi:hypothetical protein TCAL_13522, partial [Tigriopus californicus]